MRIKTLSLLKALPASKASGANLSNRNSNHVRDGDTVEVDGIAIRLAALIALRIKHKKSTPQEWQNNSKAQK